jgi:hypothetical protein
MSEVISIITYSQAQGLIGALETMRENTLCDEETLQITRYENGTYKVEFSSEDGYIEVSRSGVEHVCL